jgi:RNA polymerase sigma factor (sigma-70 family)
MLQAMGTPDRSAAAAGARRHTTPYAARRHPDVVRIYLDEVGRHHLLAAEEEVSLARAIEAGRAASEALGGSPALSHDERTELHRRVLAGDRARTAFIDANLRLVVSVAKRYTRPGVALADLVQEGNVGLMRAVERWEWRRGWRFATYATWWVRKAVIRAADSSGRTVRLPAHVTERAWTVRRLADEHLVAMGRAPTRQELAEAAGTTEAEVDLLVRAVRVPVSLSSPVDDDGTELADILSATGEATPEDEAAGHAVGNEIEALLALLSPREASVVRARFGIGQSAQTLDEVATGLAVSGERVRQIEARGMAKLRMAARARGTRSVLTA